MIVGYCGWDLMTTGKIFAKGRQIVAVVIRIIIHLLDEVFLMEL